MTFVKKLAEERVERELHFQRAVRPRDPERTTTKKEGGAVAIDEFRGLHVGEKVLRQHALSFKQAIADMHALEDAGAAMEPHRAKQFGRALEAYYAKVATHLSKLPIAERADGAEAAVKEARTLIERITHDEIAPAALAAMTDLLGYAADSKLAAPASRKAVTALLEATEGRAGATSAFNVFPNIVWHLEDSAPIGDEQRRFARWEEIAGAVANALPRTAFDQVHVANLAAYVTAELAKAPQDDRGALARAAQKIFDETAPSYAQARANAQRAHAPLAQAVVAAIDANPAGPPSLGKAFEDLINAAVQHAGDAQRQAAWTAIAQLVDAGKQTPSVETLVRFLAAKGAPLTANAAARAELARVGGDLAAIPTALIRASATLNGVDVNRPDVQQAIEAFAQLPPSIALDAALAAAPNMLPGRDPIALLWAVTQFAKKSPTCGSATIESFAKRFSTVHPELLARIGDEKSLPIAFAAARANLAEALELPRAQQIANLVAGVLNVLPDATMVAEMIADEEKKPGLITLSNPPPELRFQPPEHFLLQLLQPFAAIDAPFGSKIVLARRAMNIANEVSKLDRDPATIWNRVLPDWRSALGQPAGLHFAMRAGNAIGVKADQQRGADNAAARFIHEHAEIPPEIAFTASIHLSSEQLGWLKSYLASERSRMVTRNVRDTIFACLDTNRLDMIEALRTTKAPRSVTSALMTQIAQEYRANRINQVPFNEYIAALKKGDDPLAAKKAKGPALADNMPAAAADADLAASLKRADADLKALLGGINGVYKEIVEAAVKQMQDGTWPELKYNSESARRALDGLTQQQLAIWMQEMVTPLNEKAGAADAPPPKAAADVKEALPLLQGLAIALTREAKLGGVEMPLAFDKASVDALERELKQTLDRLHKVDKGTDEHRTLSRKAGPLAANLSVIELQLELAKRVEKKGLNPGQTIVELKPLLERARSGARKLGARGCAEVIERLIDMAPPVVRRTPRQGIYAADDDSLESWVTSFDAGCIASKHGQNKLSQAEFIGGAQYRMLRVCEDHTGITRSMYRLLRIDTPNYKGHALWMDNPYNVGRGKNPTQEHYQLAYKHGMKKAMAMGIPFMFHNHAQGAAQAAQALGVQPQQMNVQIMLDRGATGLHHSQGVSGGQYFFAWPGAYNPYNGYHINHNNDTHTWNAGVSIIFPQKV